MDDPLFEDVPYSFLLKLLLFAGKALEYHGLRSGNDDALLLPSDEFRLLWRQFPGQRFINPTAHRVVRITPFEFYEHLFVYDYLLLTREAIDRGEYLVMPVEMLTFVTIIRIIHEPENTQAKQDLVVLMQDLGIWPLDRNPLPRRHQTCTQPITQNRQRNCEKETMTYINDLTSAGEWARLDHQAGLVGSITGLLPPLLEDEEWSTILDIGCGPGRWALDAAAERPETQVIGVDLSRDLMDYANARARTQRLNNVSFLVQDILANKHPFPEQSFDLIHIRFAVGWLKKADWIVLLRRCVVLLKPGGSVVITEGESIYTTSPALQHLQELLCQALYVSGYGLSGSPRFIGVVARLGSLLTQTGFQQIHTDVSVLDYSYAHEEANRAWRESFHALIHESSFFLLQAGVTTAEELTQVDAQLSIEMYQEDFCGVGPLFTFSAQRPTGAPNE